MVRSHLIQAHAYPTYISATVLSAEEHIRYWRKPGHDWHTYFCSTCGSALPGENDEDNMYIPVGLLATDADNLNVAQHLHVGSKASWEEIGDDGQQHE